MKILLPADGSACSLRAVDQLIAHIDCLREVPEIHLLHVHLPIPIGRVQAHVGKETLHAYYLEEGQQQLQAAQQKLDAAGRFHTTHIHVGQPAEVIGKMAAELCLLQVHSDDARKGVCFVDCALHVLAHLCGIDR